MTFHCKPQVNSWSSRQTLSEEERKIFVIIRTGRRKISTAVIITLERKIADQEINTGKTSKINPTPEKQHRAEKIAWQQN
jgi:hypothetical protein